MKEHESRNEIQNNKENKDPNKFKMESNTKSVSSCTSNTQLNKISNYNQNHHNCIISFKNNQDIIGLRKKPPHISNSQKSIIKEQSISKNDRIYTNNSNPEFQEKLTNSKPKSLKELFRSDNPNSVIIKKGSEEFKNNNSFYNLDYCMNFHIEGRSSITCNDIESNKSHWDKDAFSTNNEISIELINNKHRVPLFLQRSISLEIPNKNYYRKPKYVIEKTISFYFNHLKKQMAMVIKNDINLSFINEVIFESQIEWNSKGDFNKVIKNSTNLFIKEIQFSIYKHSEINDKNNVNVLKKYSIYYYLISFLGIGLGCLLMYKRYKK